jgi:hypothetical protein
MHREVDNQKSIGVLKKNIPVLCEETLVTCRLFVFPKGENKHHITFRVCTILAEFKVYIFGKILHDFVFLKILNGMHFGNFRRLYSNWCLDFWFLGFQN